MFARYPFFSRLLLLVVLPASVFCWWLFKVYLVQSLPDTQKLYTLTWQDHTAEIQRDGKGILMVRGDNFASTHFAMGFAHAQDRLWQLELQKRLSQGRLAELFGKSALSQDIFFRTLGIYRAAEQAFNSLDPDAQASLTAYTAGINFYLSQNPALPIEFEALGITPERWTPIDSMAWAKVFALSLGGNYNAELQRMLVTKFLPPELRSTFFADLAGITAKPQSAVSGSGNVSAGLTQLIETTLSLEEQWQIGGPAVGSNAWVVAGKFTESGNPFLASDPHLGLQIPSLWYSVIQRVNNLTISGMSLVGLPVVVFGQNNHIAWGGTNMTADAQDLVIETLKPDDQNYYLFNNQWEALATRVEEIHVKADFPAFLKSDLEPVNLLIRETRNGPIVSDHLNIHEMVLSLRWTGLDRQDTTFQALLEINKAHNWTEFRQALTKFKAPAMNFVYADAEGNIALQGAGALPVRAHHTGAFPVKANIAYPVWREYVAFDDMPVLFNPESGYVANANNHITKAGPLISVEEVDTARMQRIEHTLQAALSSGNPVTVDQMKAMQLDARDISVDALLAVMLRLPNPTEQESQIITWLKDWDKHATAESVPASIYYFWLRHLKQTLFDKQLSKIWTPNRESAVLRALTARVSAEQVAVILTTDNPWCSASSTTGEHSCATKLRHALQDAIEDMSLLAGDSVDDWHWGAFQQSSYAHQPFSQINGLKSVFGREYPTGGAANTLNVAGSSFKEKQGYRKQFGAGFRQVIALNGSNFTHWLAHAGGQSGQVMSQHYDDMLIEFERGEFVRLPTEMQSAGE